MIRNYYLAFALGVKAAELAHGVTKKGREMELADATYRAIWEIAEGSLTLLNSPEEMAADAPPVPPGLAAAMPDLQDQVNEMVAKTARSNRHEGMKAEREMAEILVNEWKLLGLKRPT